MHLRSKRTNCCVQVWIPTELGHAVHVDVGASATVPTRAIFVSCADRTSTQTTTPCSHVNFASAAGGRRRGCEVGRGHERHTRTTWNGSMDERQSRFSMPSCALAVRRRCLSACISCRCMRETWEVRAWMEGNGNMARWVRDGRCFLPQDEPLCTNITNGTTLPCANSIHNQMAKEYMMHETSNPFDASSSHVRVARQSTPCGHSCRLKREQAFGSHVVESLLRKKQHDGLGCKRATESCLHARHQGKNTDEVHPPTFLSCCLVDKRCIEVVCF